ncbi:hypothetical protein RB601_004085 [Gaeumannomyces tritici]
MHLRMLLHFAPYRRERSIFGIGFISVREVYRDVDGEAMGAQFKFPLSTVPLFTGLVPLQPLFSPLTRLPYPTPSALPYPTRVPACSPTSDAEPPTMSREVTLEGLPLETREHIAGYVSEAHRPSIFAFSAASKACNKAARKFIFRHVSLRVDDPATLARDVAAVTEIIRTRDCHELVRSLSVEGHLILREEERPAAPQHPRRGAYYELTSWLEHIQAWLQRTGVSEILGDVEPHPYDGYRFEEPMRCPPDEDQAWGPLVRLLAELPYLAKMVYNCRNQFPPSLLDVIHTHHPRCKLHLMSFRLRSLRLPALDPHELALATSPCLHTVHLKYSSRDRKGDDDFNEQAMLELVSGLAPNLKMVRTVFLALPSPVASMDRIGDPQPALPTEPVVWGGLPGFVPDSGGKGSLTSWSPSGVAPINKEFLEKWEAVTDFACLRHLDLGAGLGSHSGVTADALEWMATRKPFPNLSTLRIRLMREIQDDEDPIHYDDFESAANLLAPQNHPDQEGSERPSPTKCAIDFFDSLVPLVELAVSGHLEPEIVDRMLARHGPTLRSLSLSPWEPIRNGYMDRPLPPMAITRECILRLQAQCPGLEELSLPVKRTRSDTREVQLYRALGGFPRLRRLLVTLDCSGRYDSRADVWQRGNPLYMEDDEHSDHDPPHYVRNGDIVNAFYNSAVDAGLARSIWDVVHASRRAHGGGAGGDGRRRRLQWLKIYTTGGDDLGRPGRYDDVFHVIENLSRSWLVEPAVRGDQDAAGGVAVRELGVAAREARDRDYTRRNGEAPSLTVSSAIHNFRRLWPPREGSSDWRDDWRSLPLQV